MEVEIIMLGKVIQIWEEGINVFSLKCVFEIYFLYICMHVNGGKSSNQKMKHKGKETFRRKTKSIIKCISHKIIKGYIVITVLLL